MAKTAQIDADQSYISVRSGEVVSYVGPDATALYQAIILKGSLNLWIGTGMRPTRHATPLLMLGIAARITGKKYKTSRKGARKAVVDLEIWIAAMKTAIPVVDI